MYKITKMLFLMVLVLGTSLTLSSETWLGMWMGLEMNLIAFIPIMYKSNNKLSSESCMIYFLIQSLGSILMLLSVLSNSLTIIFPYMVEELCNSVLMFSMFIKLGVPPFHFWFPEILDKMNWLNCTILMTWQKIAPLSILSYILEKNWMIPMFIMMSVVVGALGGLNQTSIRKILGFSSISHMGWMMACMKYNNEFWIKYLIIYMIIVIMMTFTFQMHASFYISQFSSQSFSFLEKFTIITLFLSLGGLPPFIGFLPKWLVIQSMILSNSYFTLLIMIMSVLITLFYYLRLVSAILLINNITIKWITIQSISLISMFILAFNLSLPFMSTFSL